MNNSTEAQSLFRDARILRDEAQESLERGYYHRVVRKCQESVELALKAMLMYAGIEYPKVHDVSKALLEGLKGKLEDDILQKMARISQNLAEQRAAAFYGTGIAPAAKMFGKKDARTALTDCDKVLTVVSETMTLENRKIRRTETAVSSVRNLNIQRRTATRRNERGPEAKGNRGGVLPKSDDRLKPGLQTSKYSENLFVVPPSGGKIGPVSIWATHPLVAVEKLPCLIEIM